MAIVVAVTENEGFGDYVFALKYAAGLRKKIFRETGRLEDIIITTHAEGVSKIRKIQGDSEYQLDVVTPEILARKCQKGMQVELLIEAPTQSPPLLTKIDKCLPKTHPVFPYYHISEYQFGSAHNLQGKHRDFAKLNLQGKFSSGLMQSLYSRGDQLGNFSGIITSPEISIREPEKKEALFQKLSITLRSKLAKMDDYKSFKDFSANNQLAIQYSHEDHETPPTKPDGNPMYPCEVFLRTYFASITQDEHPKKNQQIFLVGKSSHAKIAAIKNSLEVMKQKGFNKIIIVEGDTGNEKTIFDQGDDGPVVRLFIQNSIPHQDMMGLFGLSDRKITGVTGDQSLGEALSASMMVIYECLHHKRGLKQALQMNLKKNIQMMQSFSCIPENMSSNTGKMVDILMHFKIIEHRLDPSSQLYEIEEAYTTFIKERAIELINIMSKSVPNEEDFLLMETLFQIPGVYNLVINAHSQVANKNDLVQKTASSLLSHVKSLSTVRKPVSDYDNFIFHIINDEEKKALDLLQNISNEELSKLVVGSNTLFQLVNSQQFHALSDKIKEKLISDSGSCEALLINKIKAVNIEIATKDEVEILKNVMKCSNLDELKKLDFEKIGIPLPLIENLPSNLNIDTIKKIISTQIKEYILEENHNFFSQSYINESIVSILLLNNESDLGKIDFYINGITLSPINLSLLLPDDAELVREEINAAFKDFVEKSLSELLKNIREGKQSIPHSWVNKIMNGEQLPDEFFSFFKCGERLNAIVQKIVRGKINIEELRSIINEGQQKSYNHFLEKARNDAITVDLLQKYEIEKYVAILRANDTSDTASSRELLFLLSIDKDKVATLKEISKKIIEHQVKIQINKITPSVLKKNAYKVNIILKASSFDELSDEVLSAVSLSKEMITLSNFQDIGHLKSAICNSLNLQQRLAEKLQKYRSVRSKLDLSDYQKFKNFKNKYQGKMSDEAKKDILSELKDKLEDVRSVKELDQLEATYKKSAEYRLLCRHSNILSRYLSSKKTNAQSLVDDMFTDIRNHLSSNPTCSK